MAGKPSRGNPPENFGKTFTPEERRANSSKGGKLSGQAKREKKRIKEILEILLDMPLNTRKEISVEDVKSFASLNNKNISVNEAIQVKQVQRALKGDLASASYIRDTIGEKPSDKVETTIKPIIISGEDELEE